jgi:hypothetical protein
MNENANRALAHEIDGFQAEAARQQKVILVGKACRIVIIIIPWRVIFAYKRPPSQSSLTPSLQSPYLSMHGQTCWCAHAMLYQTRVY